MLETLVELGLTDDWQHMIDSTIVRGHSQTAGAKGGLIRRALVEAAAALRAKSTPAQTVRDVLLALSSPAAKFPVSAVPLTPCVDGSTAGGCR
ncbi:hypothetical protein ACFONL_21765, partial [Camelimonas fluminis]